MRRGIIISIKLVKSSRAVLNEAESSGTEPNRVDASTAEQSRAERTTRRRLGGCRRRDYRERERSTTRREAESNRIESDEAEPCREKPNRTRRTLGQWQMYASKRATVKLPCGSGSIEERTNHETIVKLYVHRDRRIIRIVSTSEIHDS